MKRRSISPSTRFSVFQRDGFTCQYCGRSAPDCVLHVDHRVPVSMGGAHKMSNFVTACSECNGGKGARVAVLPEDTRWVEDFEEQMVASEHLMFLADPWVSSLYGELVV